MWKCRIVRWTDENNFFWSFWTNKSILIFFEAWVKFLSYFSSWFAFAIKFLESLSVKEIGAW